MERQFFDAISPEQQEKTRKLMEAFEAPKQDAPKPIPGSGYVSPAAFPESRTERRARERAEAKAARRKVKA